MNTLTTLAKDLRGTSLLSVADLGKEGLAHLLELAAQMKEARSQGRSDRSFAQPKTIAMIFEKPSLRTRVTFEVAIKELGGHSVVLGPQEIGLGTRESVPDVARNLERWVHAIMARVFEHRTLEELQENCSIPVVNGLSDREHPCQAVTDLLTIRETKGGLSGLKLAYIGDGNNVLHSLMLACALVGIEVVAAAPPGYAPDAEILAQARAIARSTGAMQVTTDHREAVVGADVVYTDVWTSMGQEKEMLTRIQVFRPYQVNRELMRLAKRDAIFLHCLPAHRGDEVTDDVLDGRQSRVFEQAENRLHAQKAILASLL